MANTSAVYARIDTNLKENAEGILAQLGISPSSAIQMLYSQIVLTKGLPLDLHLPRTKPTAIPLYVVDEAIYESTPTLLSPFWFLKLPKNR